MTGALGLLALSGVGIVVALFSKKANALSLTGQNTSPSGAQIAQGATIQQGSSSFQPGTAQKLTTSGVTTGVAAAGAFSPAGSALATAVPIIGVFAGIGLAVWGAISAKHREAIALEAQTLNQAVPIFQDGLKKVVYWLSTRQVTPLQAQAIFDQMKTDYHNAVSKIQKGNWPWSGPLDFVGAGGSGVKPDPCNGPCEVEHYWIFGDAGVVMMYANEIYNGAHGKFELGPIPPHAGFNGAAKITIQY